MIDSLSTQQWKNVSVFSGQKRPGRGSLLSALRLDTHRDRQALWLQKRDQQRPRATKKQPEVMLMLPFSVALRPFHMEPGVRDPVPLKGECSKPGPPEPQIPCEKARVSMRSLLEPQSKPSGTKTVGNPRQMKGTIQRRRRFPFLGGFSCIQTFPFPGGDCGSLEQQLNGVKTD